MWHFACNFFVTAIPYVMLGNYIAFNEGVCYRIGNAVLILTYVFGMIFSCSCIIFDWRVKVSEVGVMISSTALFLLAVKNPGLSINRQVELLGEKFSLHIYIIHILISDMIGLFLIKMNLEDKLWVLWMKPVAVAVSSIIWSVLIVFFLNIMRKTFAKAD